MRKKIRNQQKRRISTFLAAVFAMNMAAEIPAVADSENIRIYTVGDSRISYSVNDMWDGNQNVSITVTNDGDIQIDNWALKYDAKGVINNLWNGVTVSAEGTEYVVRNAGYNFAIQPGDSVTFGYTLTGDSLGEPTDFQLYSKRNERAEDSYAASLRVESDWDSGFIGYITIENTGDDYIEGWKLTYDANFNIETSWDASVESPEDGRYLATYNYTTSIIAPGESKSFGFKASKEEGTTPEICGLELSEVDIMGDTAVVVEPSEEPEVILSTAGFAPINLRDTYYVGEKYTLDMALVDSMGYVVANTDVTVDGEVFTTDNKGIVSISLYSEEPCVKEIFLDSEYASCEQAIVFNEVSLDAPVINVSPKYEISMISWDSDDADNYEIYKAEGEGGFEKIADVNDADFYFDYEVTEGEDYSYYVVAQTSGTRSERSNVVKVVAEKAAGSEEDITDGYITDIMDVYDDFSTLDIGLAEYDRYDAVTKDVVLRDTCSHGSGVSWASSNSVVVDSFGNVNRPSRYSAEVTLTAYVSKGGFTLKKDFTLTVVRTPFILGDSNLSASELMELNGGDLPEIEYKNNNAQTGLIKSIDGVFSNHAIFCPEEALAVADSLSALTGSENVNERFKLKGIQMGKYVTNYKFIQCCKGLEVIGSELLIRTKNDGTSKYFMICDIDNFAGSIIPTIPAENIENYIDGEAVSEPELVIYAYDGDYKEAPALAWRVQVHGDEDIISYIHADTGELIGVDNLTSYAGYSYTTFTDHMGREMGLTTYNDGFLFKKPRNYMLADYSNNIFVFDTSIINTSDFQSSSTPYMDSENCIRTSDNVWDTDYEIDAAELFDNLFLTQQFYSSKFDIGTFDGLFQPIVAFVDNSRTLKNAYYNRSKGGYFVFGDAPNKWNYGNDLGIVGHEYTHAVMDKYKGNPFQSKSNGYGALNEAYADIISELMEITYRDELDLSPDNEWLVGAEVSQSSTLSKEKDAIRCISDKYGYEAMDKCTKIYHGSSFKNFCQDSTHTDCENACTEAGGNWNDDNCDNGNIHNNSGVISYAAYNMYIDGIDVDTLLDLWFYSVDEFSAYSSSDKSAMMDCRTAVERTACDMGLSDSKINIIKAAFDKVGLTTETLEITFYDKDADKTLAYDGYIDYQVVDIDSCRSNCYHYLQYDGCCHSDCRNGLACDPKTCYHKCDEYCYHHCTAMTCCSQAFNYRVPVTDGKVTLTGLNQGYVRIMLDVEGYELIDESILVKMETDHVVEKTLTIKPERSTLSGRITIADDDMDISNNLPLEGVELKAIRQTDDTHTIKHNPTAVTTDADGKYSLKNLYRGTYEITISKNGYITLIQTVEINGRDQRSNIEIEAISDKFKGLGYASGHIYDSLTGRGVSGLTLRFRENIGTKTGDVICETTTGTDGSYKSKALDAGYYTIEIADTRAGLPSSVRYKTNYFSVKVLGDTEIKQQNGVVTNDMNKNQMRVVLTWGAVPSDLDSHMVVYNDNGFQQAHVYYSNKNYYSGGQLMVNLDVDDVSSYGPETTTIYQIKEGMDYTFYIYNFSRNSISGLSDSGAKVEIYYGDQYRCLYVPSGSGYTWNVFKLDGSTGDLRFTNTIS